MNRWNNRYWMALSSSSIAAGVQLVAAADALAHGGSHGKEAEVEAPAATGEQHTPSSEAASSTSPAPSETDTIVMPTTESPSDISDKTLTQESSSAPISQASISEGFSLGVGESLLGFLIAGPFLLISLKKQLKS